MGKGEAITLPPEALPEKDKKIGKPRAGTIPYRLRDDGIVEFLIITTENGSGKWVLPKGKIDKGDTPQLTAVKETMEEAGVQGELNPEVFARYNHSKRKQNVEMYLLKVTHEDETWDEEDVRERRWVTLNEAEELVSKNELIEVLKMADEQLGG